MLFVEGLKKLLSKENNWTFLQPLTLSLEYCIGCQTCADSCHVFQATGGKEIYRPTYRSEVWRRLVNKYVKPGGKILAQLKGADIDLNWTTITRLYELTLSLQPLPALCSGLPGRCGQRPHRPRAAEALQPGAGLGAHGTPRQGNRAPAGGGLFHGHEPGGGQGQRGVHRRGHDGR